MRGKKNKFIENLQSSLGIIATACKKTNIARGTYYVWYNNDPDFKKKCDEINEITLDVVENELLKKVTDGDTTAILFYLKTKGKKRGYVERVEQNVMINPFIELMQAATSQDQNTTEEENK